jgi:hypothetical protein
MALQVSFASGFRTVTTKHLLHSATNAMNHSLGHFLNKRPEADYLGFKVITGRSGAIWYELSFADLDSDP